MPILTLVALAYLFSSSVVVGVWAYGFPTGFYGSFPGLGRTWVSMAGPFNEHLVRDAGAAFLMIAALAGPGLLKPAMTPPFTVGLATMFFNLPHFAYHMTHLGMYGPIDQVGNVVTLGSAVLCSAWLMTPRARVRQ